MENKNGILKEAKLEALEEIETYLLQEKISEDFYNMMKELSKDIVHKIFKFYDETFTMVPRKIRNYNTLPGTVVTTRVRELEESFTVTIIKEFYKHLNSDQKRNYGYLVVMMIHMTSQNIHRAFHLDPRELEQEVSEELDRIVKICSEDLHDFFRNMTDCRGDHKYILMESAACHMRERLLNEILESFILVPRKE